MTGQYYASKCIQHVKHSILRPQVASWPQMEEEGRLSYQDILITIAQWSQPTLDISTRDISGELDLLASRILSDLEQSSPGHPIFRKIREEQEIRNEASVDLSKLPNFNGNLAENVWSSQDSKEILKSANNVLYDVEGFVGNHDDYYNADNSYINCLLDNKRVSTSLSSLSSITLSVGNTDQPLPALLQPPLQAGGSLSSGQLSRTLPSQVVGASGGAGPRQQVHLHRRLQRRPRDDGSPGEEHVSSALLPGRVLSSGGTSGRGSEDAEKSHLYWYSELTPLTASKLMTNFLQEPPGATT